MHSFLVSTCVLFGTLGSSHGPKRWEGAPAFLGNPGGIGSVQIFDLGGGRNFEFPAGLQGVRLLPIDAVGRTQLDEYRPDRPRRREDVPGAARLVLPESRGSLYEFERPETSGDVSFGFFRVDPLGVVSIVLERTVAGASADDPFVDRIAVSPRGDSFLVATTLAAGGDLLEVGLDTGVVLDRTASLPPLTFRHASLALAETWGVAVSTSGVLRFDRAGTSDAEFVPSTDPVEPVWFGDALVMSSSGAFAAAIAGENYGSTRPYVLDLTGPMRAASSQSFAFEGAGFLPEKLDGPYLAVSDDGRQCAFRASEETSGSYDSEVFVGTLEPDAPPDLLHLTADEVFEPYLDEVGVFVFRATGTLLFAAAESPATSGSGMDGMDLFEMTPGPIPGDFSVQNLTQSSGEAVPPFLNQPTLVPGRVHWIESAGVFLVHAKPSAGRPHGVVLRVDPATHCTTELVHEADVVDALEIQDSHIFLSTSELLPREGSLWKVPPTITNVEALTFASDPRLLRAEIGPQGMAAMVLSETGGEALYLVRLDTGESWRECGGTDSFGPTIAFRGDGSVVVSAGPAAGPIHLERWTAGSTPRPISSSIPSGFVLPGL